MGINNVTAIVIAIGYLAGIVGLWHVRGAYKAVRGFGWPIFAAVTLWVGFYVIEIIVGLTALPFLIWLSRTAHAVQISILGLAIWAGREVTKGKEGA